MTWPQGYGPAPTGQASAPAKPPAKAAAPSQAPPPGVLQWLATQTPNAVTAEIIKRYPEFSGMAQIPEIRDLIERAAQTGLSNSDLQAELWNTQWWKDTPQSSRVWQGLKLSDPAQASQQARQMSSEVIATGHALGLDLTPAEVAWYSEFASGQGWDVPTLTRNMLDSQARNEFHAGTIASTQDALHATASDYGISVSNPNAFQWAKQIAEGQQTTAGFTDWAKNQAKNAYPTLAKELDAGLTINQIGDPYKQAAAQTLGIDPATISFTDAKWQRALQARDAKGNLTGPMTTMDWQRTLMSDPAYGYDRSANGRDAALQMGQQLSKTFGFTT